MKKCTKCKTSKNYSEFYKRKTNKDGLRSECKLCSKKYNSEYYNQNSSKIKERVGFYREDNIEKIREYDRERSKTRSPELNRYYLSIRRARKKSATPKWLSVFDKDYIKQLYIQCVELEKTTGTKYNVDHIIPIIQNKVCGLHVPWNLQILEDTTNFKKSNNFDGTNDNDSWKKEIN